MFSVTLKVTNDCNLRCTYCYEQQNKQHMSLEIAKKSIDFGVNNAKENNYNQLLISFYGGEPLLRWEMIKEVIEYANELTDQEGIKILYDITTNGTLMNEDIMDILIDNNVSVRLSLDGNKDSTNKNRIMKNGKSAYDEIIKNIYLFKKYESTTGKKVHVSMVINKNTYKQITNNIKSIIGLGFMYIDSVLNYLENWTDEELNIIEKEYNETLTMFIECQNKEKPFFWEILYHAIQPIKKRYKHFFCGAGKKQLLVTPKGNFYPCTAATKRELQIGHIDSGFEQGSRKLYLEYQRNAKEECVECNYVKYCIANDCIIQNYELTGEFNQVPKYLCHYTKIQHRLGSKYLELTS